MATLRRDCECPCHVKGDPGSGYSWTWDDDRGIRHEDWFDCRCGCPKGVYDERHIRESGRL